MTIKYLCLFYLSFYYTCISLKQFTENKFGNNWFEEICIITTSLNIKILKFRKFLFKKGVENLHNFENRVMVVFIVLRCIVPNKICKDS